MKQIFLATIFIIAGLWAKATTHIVEASSFMFNPSVLTINVGDTVQWNNIGGFHNVNGVNNTVTGQSFNNPENFTSVAVGSGQIILVHVFTIPGIYDYDCSVGTHAANGMVGQIIVQNPSIVDIVVNSPDHTTLETAVIEANLVSTLSGTGPFTVFAPTDDAFNNLPAGLLQTVLADSILLNQILTHHVYGGEAYSNSLSNGMSITTLNGDDLMVTIDTSGNVMIDNAMVTVADISASNGVVHVIDAVLIPAVQTNTVVDIIINSPDHSTLETAVIEANLVSTLSGTGPFTVFAPTDDAFNNLPAGLLQTVLADSILLNQILTHHVYGGEAYSNSLSNGMSITTLNGDDLMVTIDTSGNVMIDNAMVTVADISASNGVVHVIDAVLIPAVQTNTVVDIIINSPDHSTLETAVIEANLVSTLSGTGPFTVFAPTDDAFDNLPDGALQSFLNDSILLNELLTRHVYSGEALSNSLSNGMTITTLNGDELLITIDSSGNVMIDNAMVTIADILADNGVVHVIDAVIIPESSSSENIYSDLQNDVLLYTVDLLGKIIDDDTKNQVIIQVYKSGKVEKKFVQSLY